jgi:hypothetical protein
VDWTLPNSVCMNVFARDPMAPPTRQAETRLMNSGMEVEGEEEASHGGVKKTKRSVSETKKKFVASLKIGNVGIVNSNYRLGSKSIIKSA